MDKIIGQYGIALRAWYVNQASQQKCSKANRLRGKIKQFELTDLERSLFLTEQCSVTHLVPAR